MADDFEMTDAPSGVSLSENAFGTANNDTGGDFQLSDWDLFELACSGKQLPDDVLDALDELAKRNLEVKLSRVGRHIEKPTIEKLYFRENEAMLVCVPLDIGLPFLLEYYNALARMEFAPTQSSDPLKRDLNRVCFYYGTDPNYSFSGRNREVRAQVILMVFCWVSGFSPKYCRPGTEPFIKAYVRAWLEGLIDDRDPLRTTFVCRENFIKLWEQSGLNLIHLSASQVKRIDKAMYKLMKLEVDDRIIGVKPEDLLKDSKVGMLDDAEFEKWGAFLALRWLHAREQFVGREQQSHDEGSGSNETAFLLQEVKDSNQKVDGIRDKLRQRGLHSESPGDRLATVDWKSDFLKPLCAPIDSTLPPPKELRRKAPKKDDPSGIERIKSFWMDPDMIKVIFGGPQDNQGTGVHDGAASGAQDMLGGMSAVGDEADNLADGGIGVDTLSALLAGVGIN